MNTDGKTFTLLENPVAMRLKKAGFIEGRRFLRQPSAQDMQAAQEKEGGFFANIFGGGGGGTDGAGDAAVEPPPVVDTVKTEEATSTEAVVDEQPVE